jgi:hypothetical protein
MPIYQTGTDLSTSTLDPRSVGSDWTRAEVALIECCSVLQHRATWERLWGLGIRGWSVTGGSPFAALAVEPVVFLPNDRFEFSRDMSNPSGWALSVIIPALDQTGTYTDNLVAWDIDGERFASWLAPAAMLGENNLSAVTCDPDLPEGAVRVHASPLEWLRAERDGVVVLDPALARWRLAERKLIAADIGLGDRLAAMMRLPKPMVLIENRSR